MPVWQKVEVPITVDIKVPEWKVCFHYVHSKKGIYQTVLWQIRKCCQTKLSFAVLSAVLCLTAFLVESHKTCSKCFSANSFDGYFVTYNFMSSLNKSNIIFCNSDHQKTSHNRKGNSSVERRKSCGLEKDYETNMDWTSSSLLERNSSPLLDWG